MSEYVPLATKLRPKKFEDFIYNEPIVAILKQMISKNKLPNGIIFSGSRGIGKTTLARLMARAINCEKRGAGEYEPCGKCESCKDALNSSHPDIIEIDGATHGNIDDVRRILDQVSHTPLISDKKVFIIDEAHQLGRSAASFDALLKTLEEPPDHVMWAFCTTAKHKIPETIKSRLVSLDLKVVPTRVLDHYVGSVMMNEWDVGKDAQSEVAPVIALAADNSLRDALTLLEKVAPYCEDNGWTRVSAIDALGSFDTLRVPDILNLVVQKNSAGLWATFSNILDSGVDPDSLFEALTKVVNDLMSFYLGSQILQPELYGSYISYFPINRLIYLTNVMLKRANDLNLTHNKKMVIQVLSLELCG